MTKKVRIENADMSNHQLVVYVFERTWDGSPPTRHDSETKVLRNPTEQCEVLIGSGRYLIVREATSND